MRTVYLVDDHAMMRDGLRSVLEAVGHRVIGESDEPTRALSEIQSFEPDIVLLDLHLGLHSGLAMLTEMQRRKLATRTIVVTMSAQPRHVAEALREGASGYVLKGSPAEELLAAIDDVAAGRRHLGREVADLAITGMDRVNEASSLDVLSFRERQIVTMVVRGQSSTEIGRQLNLSPKTVDSYRSRLMAKIGVRDVPSLVRFAIRVGLIDADDI